MIKSINSGFDKHVGRATDDAEQVGHVQDDDADVRVGGHLSVRWGGW